VEHDAHPAHRHRHGRAVGDVAVDHFHPVAHRQQIGGVAGAEVVEDAHAAPPRQQRLDQVRADEPRAARNQARFHEWFS
jgi:hypothetical protein